MTYLDEKWCKEMNMPAEAYEHSILTLDGDRDWLTDEEIHLIERCVMSEAGSQNVDTQEAVATVILNRWQCPDKYGATISDVINAEGQFSTHDNGEPTVSVRLAVRNAIVYYNTYLMCIPREVLYFRAYRYHDFGVPYCTMQDLYFSTASDVLL